MSKTYELDPYGMKWMGEVPGRWSVEPAKRHFDIQLGKMLQNDPSCDTDRIVPYFKALHVLWGAVNARDLPEMWASPSELRQYGLVSGDLLVCEGGEVGRAGIVTTPPRDSIIQNALHRVRAKNSGDVRFLMYVLHSVSSAGWFDVLCNKATIAHFTGEKFASLRIPLPPNDEQQAIADFLDRETGRIDALIEKKQRQIELLQEKRTALISHAVTKGLDPNAKMKDSGIEWLGEIPKHWEVRRLKYTADLINQKVDGAESDLPYMGLEHIESWTGKRLGQNGDASSDGQANLYGRGDVLFGKLRPYLAKAHAAKIDGICTGELLVLRPKTVKQKFLLNYVLNPDFVAIVDSSTYGAKMPRANWEFIGNLPALIPPMHEQQAIADFLDRETARIDALIEKVQSSIAMLRKYRTALISAAVTGKIDVRKEVA